MIAPSPIAAALLAALLGGCTNAANPPADPPPVQITGPVPLPVTSETRSVQGVYAPIALDQVDRVLVEGGKLVIRGTTTSVTVDPPEAADVTKVTRRWALITEADIDNKRVLVFTHEESLDDFTVELPATDAPIRFGVFEGRSGGEVMVLAWGEASRSYWGSITIAPRR